MPPEVVKGPLQEQIVCLRQIYGPGPGKSQRLLRLELQETQDAAPDRRESVG
jgi:hypothetical protein